MRSSSSTIGAPGWSGARLRLTQGEAAERLAALDLVLLDLDGTLIDSVALIRESLRHATREVLGEALPDEVLMRNVGVPLYAQMEDFAPGRATEMIPVYREHNRQVHDKMLCEYPGTEAALAKLAGLGVEMAVVTSKSRPIAIRGLELFGLDRYFSLVVAMEDTELHKPEPDPLVHAMRELDAAPHRCAYVGDAAQDMQAASAAGVLAIAALWGVHPPERVLSPGADIAVESLGELAQMASDARGALRD